MIRISSGSSSDYIAGWISELQKQGWILRYFTVTPEVPSGLGGHLQPMLYHAMMEKM